MIGKTARRPEDSADDGRLRFVFFVQERKGWAQLKGSEQPPPAGALWEARSFPGDAVGWGATRQAAVRHLQHTLEAAFARAASAQDWYRREWRRIIKRIDRYARELKSWHIAWDAEPSRTEVLEFSHDSHQFRVLDSAEQELAGAC